MHPDHTHRRLTAGYRASGLPADEAERAAALDLANTTNAAAWFGPAEFAAWVLSRHGFELDGETGQVTSPNGVVLEIRVVGRA